MNSRYLAAKLFFALAALCAIVGAVLFRRETIGTGLTWKNELNVLFIKPLIMVSIPRLIPFAASILSACFGLVYLGVEKIFKRPANILLAMIHLVSFVIVILSHETVVRYWWGVLGDKNAPDTPFPISASILMAAAIAVCLLAFVVNIFWSMSRTPRITISPRY
jgi:hypothetical protein